MEKCKLRSDQRFIRDSWDENILSFEKDRDHGFSCPQRNYKCSFCDREFKSAQALGGHMNVHRRERARLRLLSPSLMDSTRSNPNTSFSPSPCEAKFLPYDKICYHPAFSCVSNPPFSASSNEELGLCSNPAEMKSTKEYEFYFDKVPIVECSHLHDMELCGGESGKKYNVAMVDVGRTNHARIVRSNEYIRLDWNMGAKDNQELDLELRLGPC